ncbi:T9SS type A sorting domain-containing protein, partial [Cryomorphaceae bacterium 1068]|nr:T9SS type A sorting domain-containing protein [Cryomorphaceae bacterium 1068]
GATVNMTGPNGYDETIITGQILGDLFENVPGGEYDYTIALDCYETITGSVTVECLGGGQGVSVFENPQEITSNNVFFFVGSPFTLAGATVNMTGPDGYDESIVTGELLGDLFENVPGGEYNYTITLDCYETITGSVTVECLGGGQGVSVFENPTEITSNNVFFFVGSPFTLAGATINLTGPDGYDESIVTGAILGDLFENVPGGDYDYTITLDCYETITGSVTVECLGGGQGVSVFENPTEITSNNVFFFVGSPFTLAGATVNMTGPNGYDETIITGQILGDLFENVPGGEYNYTITLDCYETITGSVTVECIGGGQGVSVSENPMEIVLDTEVTQDSNVLTASAEGVEYQWIDCSDDEPIEGETSQTFAAEANGEYAVIITSENCSSTSECFNITTVGVENRRNNLNLAVFPNPFRNQVNISLEGLEGNTTVEVYSVSGQQMLIKTSQNSGNQTLDLSNLPSGVYVLKVSNGDGLFIDQIIKQ